MVLAILLGVLLLGLLAIGLRLDIRDRRLGRGWRNRAIRGRGPGDAARDNASAQVYPHDRNLPPGGSL